MKRHVRWIAVLAILSLSACSLMPPRPVSDPEKDPSQAAAVKTRWIGLAKTGSCPLPSRGSGWIGRPLFPLEGLREAVRKSALQAGLDRFCVYEYGGFAADPELPPEIVERLSRGVEPDRVAMAGSAALSLEEITWRAFRRRFDEGVQIPIPANLPAAITPAVRLAVLDTQPDREDVPESPGWSEHGYSLEHMAAHLACRGVGDCTVQIASRLALPVVKFDAVHGREQTDVNNGGFHGTYASLVKALWDEVTAPGRPPHLVLNLSLGWDGEKLGGWQDPKDMTPDVQAVYRVLEFAADQGVLVIAAAGNELSGPNPTTRPLLPGGWESLAQPGGKPLVYAVSGLDGGRHPLVNTRAHGEAPRAAYADHAVVPDFYDPKRPTATLTGSSVAAVVVSTAAALVWSQHPAMTPAEVMAHLDQSADPLGRRPDFASASDPLARTVRRISVCKALSPAPAACDSAESKLKSMESVLSPFQAKALSAGSLVVSPVGPRNPNLLDQPWIGPQPGADPCPSCAVTGPPDRTVAALPLASPPAGVAQAAFRSSPGELPPPPVYNLRLEIPSSWAAGALQSATLEIFGFDANGRRGKLLFGRQRTVTMQHGETLKVEGISAGTPIQARLVFVLAPPAGSPPGTSPLSVDSPLFVEYEAPR
jgi:Subtilase family